MIARLEYTQIDAPTSSQGVSNAREKNKKAKYFVVCRCVDSINWHNVSNCTSLNCRTSLIARRRSRFQSINQARSMDETQSPSGDKTASRLGSAWHIGAGLGWSGPVRSELICHIITTTTKTRNFPLFLFIFIFLFEPGMNSPRHVVKNNANINIFPNVRNA